MPSSKKERARAQKERAHARKEAAKLARARTIVHELMKTERNSEKLRLLQLTNSKYDCITFDHSGEGPPLRLNMFDPIEDQGEE